MRISKVLSGALLLVSVSMATGCDFLRTIAGRPTSSQIEQRALQIHELQEKAEAEAVRADSIAAEAAKVAADVVDSSVLASVPPIIFTKLSDGKIRVDGSLPSRYIVIVGAFSVKENAEKLAEQFLTKGYSATTLTYKNGFTAVGVASTDSRVQLYGQLVKLKDEPLCPKDAWVLVNE